MKCENIGFETTAPASRYEPKRFQIGWLWPITASLSWLGRGIHLACLSQECETQHLVNGGWIREKAERRVNASNRTCNTFKYSDVYHQRTTNWLTVRTKTLILCLQVCNTKCRWFRCYKETEEGESIRLAVLKYPKTACNVIIRGNKRAKIDYYFHFEEKKKCVLPWPDGPI